MPPGPTPRCAECISALHLGVDDRVQRNRHLDCVDVDGQRALLAVVGDAVRPERDAHLGALASDVAPHQLDVQAEHGHGRGAAITVGLSGSASLAASSSAVHGSPGNCFGAPSGGKRAGVTKKMTNDSRNGKKSVNQVKTRQNKNVH